MLGVATTQRGRRMGPQQISLSRGSRFAVGLNCWYPMANQSCWGTNRLLDCSPYNSNHANFYGLESTDWKLIGRAAIESDGSSDYVSAPSAPQFDLSGTNYTISLWVNITGGVSWAGIIAKGDGSGNDWTIQRASGGSNMRVYHANSSREFSGLWGDLENRGWTLLTVTFDGTDIEVYFDGDSQATSSSPAAITHDSNKAVHVMSERTGRSFAGMCDDVRIYKRRLSPAEITQLFSETRSGGYGSLTLPMGPRIWPIDTLDEAADFPYNIYYGGI